MTIIKGSDVVGIVNDIPIFCGLGLTFTESKDVVERTPTPSASGLWTYSALVKRSWSVEINGLTKIDPSDGQEDYFTMISDPFAYSFQVITISFTDQENNNVSLTGVMFLQRSSISGPATGFSGATVLFQGTGEYVLSTEGSSSTPVSCVPVAVPGYSLPDATLNTFFDYLIGITGTAPFALGTPLTIRPWMDVAIVGSNLEISGITSDINEVLNSPFEIEIHVTNDCGEVTLLTETFTVNEDGRNVFVINNSSSNISLTNDNGHSYTFLAANGSDDNIKMQTDTVNITSITGTKNYEFLQTLPSDVINSGTTSGGTITTADFSITNYLRFSD